MSQRNSLPARGDDPDLDEVLDNFIFPIWLERVYEELPRIFGEFRAAVPLQHRAAFSRYVARGPTFFHDFLMRGSIHARSWRPLDEPPLQPHQSASGPSSAPAPDTQRLPCSTSQQSQGSVPRTDELPTPSDRFFTATSSRTSSTLSGSSRSNRPQTPRPCASNLQAGESPLSRHSSSKKSSVPMIPPNASRHLTAQVTSNRPSQTVASNSGLSMTLLGAGVASGSNLSQSLPLTQNQTIAPPPYSEFPSGPQNQPRRPGRRVRSNMSVGFQQLQTMENAGLGGMTAAMPARVPSTPAQASMTAPTPVPPVTTSAIADAVSPTLLRMLCPTNDTPLFEAPAFPGLMISTTNAAPQTTVPQNEALLQNGIVLQNSLSHDTAPAQNTYYGMIQQNDGMQVVHPQIAARLQQMQREDLRLQQAMGASMTPRLPSALASRKRRRSENSASREDQQGNTSSPTKRMKQSQMSATGTGSDATTAISGSRLNGPVRQAIDQLVWVDSNSGTAVIDPFEQAPFNSEQDQPE